MESFVNQNVQAQLFDIDILLKSFILDWRTFSLVCLKLGKELSNPNVTQGKQRYPNVIRS